MTLNLKLASALFLGFAAPAFSATGAVTIYSNPTCGCCQTYGEYLKANGYEVTMVPDQNYDKVAVDAGMPAQGIGCHVAVMDGYTMSGFIPVKFIEKLVAEKPEVTGITLPGMRMDAPDLPESELSSLQVYTYAPTGVALFPLE